jgi:hypothetical protein
LSNPKPRLYESRHCLAATVFNTEFMRMKLKHSTLTFEKKRHCVFIKMIHFLIIIEIMVFYTEKNTKPVNLFCGQTAVPLNV